MDRTASDASESTDASGSGRDRLAEIREDLARVANSRDGPKDGIVAVKVASHKITNSPADVLN